MRAQPVKLLPLSCLLQLRNSIVQQVPGSMIEQLSFLVRHIEVEEKPSPLTESPAVRLHPSEHDLVVMQEFEGGRDDKDEICKLLLLFPRALLTLLLPFSSFLLRSNSLHCRTHCLFDCGEDEDVQQGGAAVVVEDGNVGGLEKERSDGEARAAPARQDREHSGDPMELKAMTVEAEENARRRRAAEVTSM
mmetsp:Transcript_33098/g.104676  ORF Transcript_33098/g.104676 Transcript_33098/m.104676 type:complete len:191 (-) Transcript_33098:2756-3328(-)